MLRFLPDGWLEWMLRPFILIDPSSGIYFEVAAPDWRFAALVLFLALAAFARRLPQRLSTEQGRHLLALFVLLYAWAFVSGNGRYFVVGMVLVGPLLMVAWRLLPGTLAFRIAILAGLVGLQLFSLQQTYLPNHWGLARWKDGPGLAIEASPLRSQPAVFLSITGISYSLLVPAFHPGARWANIAGQRDITPEMKEHPRLRSMLASGLPIYVLAPLNPTYMSAELQPTEAMLDLFVDTLAVHDLKLTGAACIVLRSGLTMGAPNRPPPAPPTQGFWFCPAQEAGTKTPLPNSLPAAAADVREVFEQVERRCPRFFPPGDGIEKSLERAYMRHYVSTDVRLYVDDQGRVIYKYFRALNPTQVGTSEQVRRGSFEIDCAKLPGRYRLPWVSD